MSKYPAYELTAEEKKFRATRVGSSEGAALLEINPPGWATVSDIAARIIGLPGKVWKMNEAMLQGKIFEPKIIERFELETGYTVKHAAPKVINEHLADNSDGLVYDGDKFLGPLEAKWTTRINDWKEGVPDYYVPQCQMHMMAWCSDQCFAIGMKQGVPPKIYTVKENPRMQKVIKHKAKKLFDDYISKGELPPIDLSDAWKAKLDLYSPDLDLSIDSTKEIDALVGEYRTLQKMLKEFEVQAELKKRIIQETMGNATRLTGENYEISWKRQSPRKSIDYKKILSEANVPEELVLKHTKTPKQGIRTFRAKYFYNTKGE